MDWIDRYRDVRGEAIQWLLDVLGIDIFTLLLVLSVLGIHRHRGTFVAYWRYLKERRMSYWSRLRTRSRNPSHKDLSTWQKLDRMEQVYQRFGMFLLVAVFIAGLLGTLLDWNMWPTTFRDRITPARGDEGPSRYRPT